MTRHDFRSRADTVDLAVLGAGAAGCSLLVHLDHLLGGRRPVGLRIAVIDPVPDRALNGTDDRTWCFWGRDAEGAGDPIADLVTHSWRRLALVDVCGERHDLDLHPLTYRLVPSVGLYRAASGAAERLGARRIEAGAKEVGASGDPEYPLLVSGPGVRLRARIVADSRPAGPQGAPRTRWLQHFRGWVVTARPGTFDPGAATLMDFSVPQTSRAVAFGYVLPYADDTALVEYTEFSPQVLTSDAYDAALTAYLTARGLSPGSYQVRRREDGVIPMTDGAYRPHRLPGVIRLGTAGGATRGSTGYTFAAVQRQTERLARSLVAGRPPVAGQSYPARHRWMDAVLLRALDEGWVDGPTLFSRLLTRRPAAQVLDFLDGRSGWRAELGVMSATPTRAMARAALVDALARLTGRSADAGC